MNSNSTKLLNILIVEDDRIDSVMLQKMLAKSLLPISNVQAVETLNDAFELLNNEDFDVILLDLNLPDSVGIDTLVEINKRYPDIANVVITGQPYENFNSKEFAKVAQEYLVKGDYNVEMLNKAIHYAIESKRIGEILARKQKNLEVIFDAVPVGMMLVDENAIVTRVNDAIRQMTGRDYSEITNNSIGVAIGCVNCIGSENICGNTPSCDRCPFKKGVEDALSSVQSTKVEVKVTLLVNGKEISPWFCVTAEPAMIDANRYAVIAIDDITPRKEAERKLKETMELKSQFISTVSHELRTPLACIKESVAIVLDGMVGKINAKQVNFLDIAQRNIVRLADLVNDVLDFQKLELGRVEFDIRQNDITRIATEVHMTMLGFAKKKKVDLILDIDGKLPRAFFDSNKIIQVLTNLVSNAIKFTPSPGKITMDIAKNQEELVISVSDTGMGIPESDLPKIFERFHRVKRQGKEIQGTGLGLAIVERIISAHGGRIEVESQVDQGTTFSVFLPIEAKPAPDALTNEKDQHLEKTLLSN